MRSAGRGRLILLRHGESEANAHDVFAGWIDVALTAAGVRQAHDAGRALAADGVRPDAVHSSVLGRAVDTARLALDAGSFVRPLTTHWRLNERHYGALQGWSKDDARDHFGLEQVERWRRSAHAAPPPLTGPALAAQVHDPRYDEDARGVTTESLGQVRRRIEPYWRGVVSPELQDGLTVLVVSHGNALRMLASLATGAPAELGATLEFDTATPVEVPSDPGSGHRRAEELLQRPGRVARGS